MDRNEKSALHIAVKERNLDLVTEILKYAKDCIEIRANEGRNALYLVIENALQIFWQNFKTHKNFGVVGDIKETDQ